MLRSMYGKCWLPAVCLVILANCAKHTLTAVATPFPATPTVNVPVTAPPARSESKAAQVVKKVTQAKSATPDVNRLLLEPPQMSFSPNGRVSRKDAPAVDKITVLVDTRDGSLRPDAQVTIQNALKVIADQFLFLCPDSMRVGATEDCRFKTKEGLNDFFRVQLLEQGVAASEASAVTVLMHAGLTSADKNAFEIRGVPASNPSSGEQLWHVVPRGPGSHKLELSVTASARIVSAGDVHGEPVMLDHPVSVSGVDNFFNDYGPAMIGCVAALGLLAWIAWALWRNARPSAFSSR